MKRVLVWMALLALCLMTPLAAAEEETDVNHARNWYEIFVRSYYDSNGDGVGDLNGIRRRLPYLAQLGIDLIWICPIFLSPMVDNGYDVADYGRVDTRYGTNEDLSALIEEAASYGIRLVLDLVINHCSDQHAWFKKAVDDPESREAGYFYFRRTQDGLAPNNWRSNFGGPAWTQLPDGRWYYHTFAPQQPDLNWENPQLHNHFDSDYANGYPGWLPHVTVYRHAAPTEAAWPAYDPFDAKIVAIELGEFFPAKFIARAALRGDAPADHFPKI